VSRGDRAWALTACLAALTGCHDNFEPRPPCDGVDCSGHGVCVDNEDLAVCVCDEGFRAEGTSCVAEHPDGDADVDADLDAVVDGEADGDVAACYGEIAGALFCDGFEDEALGAWLPPNEDGGSVDRVVYEVHAGSGALHAEFLEVGGHGFVTTDSFGTLESGDFYVRAYYYVQSSVGFSGAALLAVGNCETQDFTTLVVSGETPALFSTEPRFSYGTSSMGIPRDGWFCVVLHVHISIGGTVALTIQGNEGLSVTPADTRVEGGYNCLSVGILGSGPEQPPFEVLVDDVALATSPLSCDP
jgi:hypothetical protein